jgi:glycosyltransferase involved in cell wall biosynthesis
MVDSFKPDIVNLHWVGGGFMPLNYLKNFSTPIVWSMHDMWALTGGCHYDNFCGRYTDSCGRCPQLSQKDKDLSHKIFHKKKKLWNGLPLTFVAASRWMAGEIKRSSLFNTSQVKIIPNGLDLQLYKPINKTQARNILGLPVDARYLLFGAMGIGSIAGTGDPRKGFQHLIPALKRMADSCNYDDLRIIIYGCSEPEEPIDLGFPIHFMGRIQDDVSLVLINSSADVTLVPSVQETFGLVAIESMACGTPVVAFGATGLLDIIEHKINGYLANAYEEKDFAKGISWLLDDDKRREKIASAAREKCEKEYEISNVAKKYRDLYSELL